MTDDLRARVIAVLGRSMPAFCDMAEHAALLTELRAYEERDRRCGTCGDADDAEKHGLTPSMPVVKCKEHNEFRPKSAVHRCWQPRREEG